MQFTTDKLMGAAKLLKLVTPTRPTHPVLAYTQCVVEGRRASLTATTLCDWLSLSTDVVSTTEGDCLLPVKELTTLKVKGTIDVFSTESGVSLRTPEIQIAYDTSKLKDEFPALPTPSEIVININSRDLLSGLERVSYAASTDRSKQVLRAINFKLQNGQLNLAATDGHRLAVTSLKATGDNIEFNLPATSVKILSQLLKSGSGVIGIGYQDGMIYFYGTHKEFDFLYSVPSIGREYLDYNRLMPSAFDYTVSLKRDVLLAALLRAKPHTEMYRLITLKPSSDRCYVVTAGKEDNFTALLSDKFSDAPEFSVNCEYLLDAVTYIKADLVILHINTALSPIVITEDGSVSTRHLLMPVQRRQ